MNQPARVVRVSSGPVGIVAEPLPSTESQPGTTRNNPDGTAWAHVGLAYGSLLLLSVGSVLLIGAGRVRDQSYWGDEAVTAAIVRRPLIGFLRVLWSQEAGMGPYYAALWMWSRAFGGDAGLRMFSVIGVAIAAAFAFDLAWRWFGAAEAVAVSTIMVVHPFALRYLVEARAYSWMMALGVGLVWVIDRWRQSPTTAWTATVGVVAGLLVSTHIAAIPFVVAVLIAVIATTSTKIWWTRRSLIIVGVTTALFALSVPALLAREGQIDWIAPVSPTNLLEIVERLYGEGWWAAFIGVGVLLLALGASRASRWQRVALLAATLLAPALVALVSIVQSLWIPRYLAPTLPLAVVAAVAGISGLGRRIAAHGPGARYTAGGASAVIAIAAIGSLVIAGPFQDSSEYRDGMHSAVAHITEQLQPGDLVLASDQEHMPLYHYLGVRSDLVPSLLTLPDDDLLYPVEAEVNEIQDRLRAAPRVFVVRNSARPIDPDITATFAGWKHQSRRFGRVAIEIYSRPS